MENSTTAAMPQQQQPQMQKKKKSKNKKGNKPTPAEVGSALEADSAKKPEFNENGLSEQLAHELHLNNSNNSTNSNNNNRNTINSTASSDKLRKTNKLANGTAKKELPAAHQVNGHGNSVAAALDIPAETKINGSPDADIQQQQQQAKKPKSKSNKQKHKESDKANNCHKVCVNKEHSTQNETVETLPVLHDQEHVEKLNNGFCTSTAHKDEMKEANSFKQNINENINTATQELETNTKAAQAEQQQLTQQKSEQEPEAATTPASTANLETENASKQQNAAEEIVASPTLDLSNVQIEYKEYESELQMHDIMRLIQAELSEPYSIYTYRYFIYNWPKLCFLAAHGNEYVGAIVCKLDRHMNVKRGYIAMLAVRKEYRKLKIGTTLVQKAIEAMLADNADEVVLETEMRNLPALRLYENLGFVRDKRLFRYYLNGVDALRLKLWFR